MELILPDYIMLGCGVIVVGIPGVVIPAITKLTARIRKKRELYRPIGKW